VPRTGIVVVLPTAAVVAVAGIEIRIVEEVCGQNIQDAARLAHQIGAKTAQTRLDPIQLANRYAEVVGEFFGRSSHIFTPDAKTTPDNFVNSRQQMSTAPSLRTLNSRCSEHAILNAPRLLMRAPGSFCAARISTSNATGSRPRYILRSRRLIVSDNFGCASARSYGVAGG